MDIMKSFAPYLNGAVLQFRDVIEEGWKTIGEETPGIEWYNSNTIINKPGGSEVGWGMEEFDPDTDWVTAVHDLDQVAGKEAVVFRIAIATDGRMSMGNQGFAFDNLMIAERTKLAVLEHFTNFSHDTSGMADDIIDAFGSGHPLDVIDLQYHMDYPGPDPMNTSNPDPPSTRSFYYGVPGVPYSVLDGGIPSNHRYDFSDLNSGLMGDHVHFLSLEIPAFDIDLSVDWLDYGLEASTNVTCVADQFNSNVQLYLVVFETSVTAYTSVSGDNHCRNVVLDMLPTPAGKLLGDNWHKGKSDFRTNTWIYSTSVEDISDLAVAAFLQDRDTRRILQAAVVYKVGTPTSTNPVIDPDDLNVYPNPSDGFIYVNLGSRKTSQGQIELLDMNSKVVLTEHVPAGYQIVQLDLNLLERGIYILRWIDSGQVKGVRKVVKTR
jgi:hypothetical protein